MSTDGWGDWAADDQLAATAEGITFDDVFYQTIHEAVGDVFADDPCPTCDNQRYINVPAGYIGGVQAYRQQRCPTCDGGPDV